MKKLLSFTLLLFSLISVSTAQTTKGNWLLGGSASFSSSKTGDYKETNFFIAPGAGYFFADNFAAGASISFISATADDGIDEYDANAFGFAPFLRYYFVKLGNNSKLFANGMFGFVSGKSDGESTNATMWQISAGPAIFLNPSIALEFALAYGSNKFKDADDATNTFGINVGFQIHLNCKKK